MEFLRRQARRLFNMCRANNSHSWERYREAQRRYRKEVRKNSKETWSTFCSAINDLPRTSRLHRAIGNLKSGWDVWWLRQESVRNPNGETLVLLFATHFPNSSAMERGVISAAACRTKRSDWGWLRRLSPIEEWDWQLIICPK